MYGPVVNWLRPPVPFAGLTQAYEAALGGTKAGFPEVVQISNIECCHPETIEIFPKLQHWKIQSGISYHEIVKSQSSL